MSVEISDQLLSRLIPLAKKACARAGAQVVSTSRYGRGGVPTPVGVPIEETATRYLIASNDEHIKIVAHAIERTPSPFALEENAFNLGVTQMEPQCRMIFSGATVSDTNTVSAHVSNYRPNDNGEVVYLDLRVDLQAVPTRRRKYSIVDISLQAFLGEVKFDLEEGKEVDLDAKNVRVVIQTKPNLSAYALRILKKLRIRMPKADRHLYTARLSIREIMQLRRRRFIISLSKSRQLRQLDGR